ncbi:hypothetical protein [Actinokineospora sp. UTMC 2448]|uniref:hypothetical protein n=1 Tax=Actinokineospora sp. UTMC 2448 TaxID=2268449 RepID=UPI002164ECAA|nr:hypothetical protein [Actinokineospora sp. UTMC 2448]UVS78250.1 hypothetical protein Actkin_01978 [Actinokineospora sp. UTMC 2448]
MSITAAETFLFTHARLLDRRRFAFLFGSGDAEPVVRALDAYRNPDGGYGHALEPDGRGADSQPLAALTAVSVLREVGALDAFAPAIADHLAKISDADGAVPFAVPAGEYPHSPWWQASTEGALLPTANLAGALADVDHPWVARAADYCWPRIEALTSSHPYEVRGCLEFLEGAPDRTRARAAADRLGELVRSSRMVRLGSDMGETPQGYTVAELPYPHEYAPTPNSLAASWFSAAEMAESLDALTAERGADGGWRPRWLIWTPVVEHEWSGPVTIEALKTLRAYGREL